MTENLAMKNFICRLYPAQRETHQIKKLLLVALSCLATAYIQPDVQAQTTLPSDGPIRLHPDNPHYFLYQGKPLALITSAEHYGALLNLDVDYRKYLKTLSDDGMNYTRIFTGTYYEIAGESFNIEHNTLAPSKDSVVTPWATSDSAGDRRYDLTDWNDAYFERLKDFMTVAAEYDIMVEVTLFSAIYRDEHWAISPQNPANNVNIDQPISRFEAQTLNNGPLLDYQVSLVRKLVKELNAFDNFFFEIQNEPWSDHAVPVYNIVNQEELLANDWTYKADFADSASLAWQEKMASVITEEESQQAQQHLIAQNYTNFRAAIPAVSDHISIINLHYAWPDAVTWNDQYDKVIGFDESGFAGSDDPVYRRQAWQFMLSGGGLFNNLDYSFYVGHEDGRGKNHAPGGGSPALRQQLKVLSEFLHSFELEKLRPTPGSVLRSPGLIPYVLSDHHQAYAIFLRATGTTHSVVHLQAGQGSYRIERLNTLTGEYAKPMSVTSEEGCISIDIDIPDGELALKITRQ